MTRFLLILFAITASGCATMDPPRVASPSFIDNNYYMMGDSACASARFISDTRIMCLNTEGSESGYRDAMNAGQLQAYQIYFNNQQVENYNRQVRAQAINQALQNVNQQLQQQTQQFQQQNQQFQPPQVMPITPPGGYKTLCLVNGAYVSCKSNY